MLIIIISAPVSQLPGNTDQMPYFLSFCVQLTWEFPLSSQSYLLLCKSPDTSFSDFSLTVSMCVLII